MYSKFVFSQGLSLGFVREKSVERQTQFNKCLSLVFHGQFKDCFRPVFRSVLPFKMIDEEITLDEISAAIIAVAVPLIG